jgi:uncharacterized protein (UPF0332 family)
MIEEVESTPELVRQTMEGARKDLKSAKEVLGTGNFDWALVIAYNAMLQAGRAFMYSRGYRPRGQYKHLAVVRFAASEMPLEMIPLLRLFDKMRIRRHKVVYEVRDTVSRSEAEGSIGKAGELIGIIGKKLGKRGREKP